jgi:hypothetical protein
LLQRFQDAQCELVSLFLDCFVTSDGGEYLFLFLDPQSG